MQPQLLQVSYLFISFASAPAGYQYKQVCVLVFCSALFRGNQGKSRRGAARWLAGLRVRRKPCRGAALRLLAPLLGPLQAAFHRDASGLQQLPQLPWFSCLSVSCAASLFWTCACCCVRKVIESHVSVKPRKLGEEFYKNLSCLFFRCIRYSCWAKKTVHITALWAAVGMLTVWQWVQGSELVLSHGRGGNCRFLWGITKRSSHL